MFFDDATGLFLGAVVLGVVHGAEPGHGWPVAATYALDQSNKWFHGFAASFLLGAGHLVSSIAMVGVFFLLKAHFELTRVNEPISLATGVGAVRLGGPVSIVAGLLLILLGIREYRHGHRHGGDGHTHEHDDQAHEQGDGEHARTEHSHSAADRPHAEHEPDRADHNRDHTHDAHDRHGEAHTHPDEGEKGLFARVKSALPFVGGHSHDHHHGDAEAAADRGLLGIAWFAFLLGFAHEEEFEIIALCAGSVYCLELMTAYALTVIAAIVSLTMLLIAGYEHFEERVEAYTDYLPLFSAVVLVTMGVGFVFGVF